MMRHVAPKKLFIPFLCIIHNPNFWAGKLLYTHIHADVSRNEMTTSINEWTHFFIKIYLSLFIRKGWCFLCVRWRQTGSYWPQVPLTIAALLSHSGWAAQLWVLRVQALCLELVLTPASYLQLTQAVCGTWLYNCLTPTCFLWAYISAPNLTTSTGQGDIPTSLTRCTWFFCLFTQVHLLIDSSVKGKTVHYKHNYDRSFDSFFFFFFFL